MNNNQAICLNCGCAVGTPGPFCANCGAQLDPYAAVCMNCGCVAGFGAAGQTGAAMNGNGWCPPGKDKTTAIILCFLLGNFGVHNFYLGETKKGVLRLCLSLGGLLTFGLTSLAAMVIWLIDLIKMFSGSYVVDPNSVM